MLQNHLVKGLVGCGSVLGTSCAVGMPIAKISQLSTNAMNQISVRGVNIKDQINSIDKDFSIVWSQINENWKSSQTGNPLAQHILTWGKILKDSTSSNSWIIQQEEWKSCWINDYGKVTYCGYLELQNTKGNYDYKIQIYYQSKIPVEEKGELRINIVRKSKDNDKLEHWESQGSELEGQWLELKNVKFENLFSFNQLEKEGEWHKIAGISFRERA